MSYTAPNCPVCGQWMERVNQRRAWWHSLLARIGLVSGPVGRLWRCTNPYCEDGRTNA